MPIVALAGVGAIADAVVALLVLLALLLVIWAVEKFGSYIPFIGAWLASNAAAFLTWTIGQLANAYMGTIWAMQTVVTGIQIAIIYPLSKVLDFTNATVAAAYWLRRVGLPMVLQAAYNYAAAIGNIAYNYALTLYYQAITFAQSVLSAAYGYALQLYYIGYNFTLQVANTAYSYALTLYNQALNYAGAVYTTLLTLIANQAMSFIAGLADIRLWVQGLVGTVVTSIESDLVTLEQRLIAFLQAYVTAAEKDIITLVDGAAVVALQDVWPNLVTDVDALLQTIPQELIDIRDDIAAIPRAIPADLVGALAALGALAVPLLRYLKECGVPMCSGLHGLMDLFDALTDAATDAALLAFVVESVRDPHAAAREISTVVGPIAREAESLFKSLIGV